MMDFIYVPAVVGIVFYGTYKLFELFVRRKERILLIDKMINSSENKEMNLLLPDFQKRNPYGTLKAACLFIGLGLGLITGFFLNLSVKETTFNSQFAWNILGQLQGIVYGASVFIFGGIGLLTAFILEMKFSKKKENSDFQT